MGTESVFHSAQASGRIKKKRKQRSADVIEEVQEQRKIPCLERENKDYSPWKNLELILSLQSKDLNLLKKVDLAFYYVKTNKIGEMDDDPVKSSQVLDTSRTIVFLNNWVQSVLISSEKNTRLKNNKPEFGTSGSLLDIRCWQIMHFCMEESKKIRLSLTCSKDFLRVIHSIAIDAASCIQNQSWRDGILSDERSEFYDAVVGCISLIFSYHGGVTNENLDLWILLIDKVLELILTIDLGKLDGRNFIVQLSCNLFEPFAKFLRVHPMRKNGFQNFIDKLLEPLLHLLHALHSSSCSLASEWISNLSKFVEEVIAQGLFHSTHIDGFLSLQSITKYKNSSDSTANEEKVVNKSYHRHLFNKIEKIVVGKKNKSALIGLGELLQLFVRCAAKHKRASVSGGVSMQLDVGYISHFPSSGRKTTSEKPPAHNSLDAELRKSVFDFFVQFLGYLLSDLDSSLQSDQMEVSVVLNICTTLRTINNLLAVCISEKLYVRTEDAADGAARNFLSFIYAKIMSLVAKLDHQGSYFASFKEIDKECLISVRKEIVVGVHHLLNIEYEVIGDDLGSLWTMAFASASLFYGSTNKLDQSELFAEILRLGCRLIDLYSELRQVDTSIFALCGAARHSLSCDGNSSLNMLFCSLQFRRSISNAIKAIPEGQVAGFIRQLSSDIKESFEWIKIGHKLSSQADLLGKVLSETYIIILESVTVTSGNSYLVGASVKNLIEIIRPSMTNLVSVQPDSSKEFFILVEGRNLSESTGCDNTSICWILVLLFRLSLSCRSLLRQAFSLMTPDASKRMAAAISDSLAIHSGGDWLDKTKPASEGFFSWIVQPPATLLNVIDSVSEICIEDSLVLFSPLLFILNVMALQRLVELNSLINSSEYILCWNQKKSKDDADSSSCHKRIKKWGKHISELKNEAAALTEFIMSTARDQIFSSSLDDAVIQMLCDNDALNFSVGSLDGKSLPTALLWIICKNVDIWCSYAAKKDLKNFLKHIIKACFCYTDNNGDHLEMLNTVKPGYQKKANMHQIALEFLSGVVAYEQKFVCRYMASCFCKILQKSAMSLFANSEVDMSSTPDWADVISNLRNLNVGSGRSLSKIPKRIPAEPQEYATCQSLLNFLMRMPQEYLSLKSSSLYITYILNFERILVDVLLRQQTTLDPCRIVQLFVTCRRVLQILAVASSKGPVNSHKPPFDCKFPFEWLLKSLSLVIGFQHALPEDIKVATFSLLDQTSDVLLTVSRDQFKFAVRKHHGKGKKFDPANEEYSPQLNPEASLGGILQFSEALEEHLPEFKEISLEKRDDLTRLSMAMSFFHGMLWGLSFAVGDDINSDFRTKFTSNNVELMAGINPFIDRLVNRTTFVLKALFLEDDPKSSFEDTSEEGRGIEKMLIEAFLSNSRPQLEKSSLLKVLKGENAEAAIFLRHLFILCASILRLNLQIDLTSRSWSLFPVVVDISQFLLLEFSRTETPHQFAFFWLDGAVKFLEELGNYFPRFDSAQSRDFYTKLIGLHLRVTGKCISLQMKGGASRQLTELKERLRMLFTTYIKRSSELHLLSAIQAVERALVGAREGMATNYEIVCGGPNSGEVSTIVAAGIDGFDMILEFVTGPKRLNMMKRHIPSMFACLYNIILHLQGPGIFCERVDSGSVIHMCIEVLNKISGKSSLFQIDPCHVAESVRIPGALFQYFLQPQAGEIDKKFSVELYTASCRMLCSALKHHTSETQKCSAILQDSVSVLLHCLEIDQVSGNKWEVQEAVKCASALRRVYEEVRQQKDVFGQCSFQFLSRYIWVYCGFGPARRGIIREVEEALRPGVYALIDSCSTDDLQHLHTVFGEGACRSSLASLQHDYKLHFQFQGKV